jgi:hypothetical protein
VKDELLAFLIARFGVCVEVARIIFVPSEQIYSSITISTLLFG